MFILDALAALLLEIVKLIIKGGIALTVVCVAALFLAAIVHCVCWEPDEGGDDDADQQQAERRTV